MTDSRVGAMSIGMNSAPQACKGPSARRGAAVARVAEQGGGPVWRQNATHRRLLRQRHQVQRPRRARVALRPARAGRPLRCAACLELSSVMLPHRSQHSPHERPKPRVLLVEDHEDTRDMFAWCMRAAGWQVATVGNGLEALLAATATPPDVIVMDLDLPVLDGIDATRRLKADDATAAIPVVACTAFMRTLHDRICAAGFEALVPKPCLPEDLREL